MEAGCASSGRSSIVEKSGEGEEGGGFSSVYQTFESLRRTHAINLCIDVLIFRSMYALD